ncbi:MAG: M20/M25/M40 family metallo-hydrolase [Nitrososphaerota archaeon]|nr:M20/M25/M40 family metallo-hydrolase [Nitrososphaerota archaeon]
MADDPLELLTEAVRIYSPTGRESRLADYLCSKMKKLGYNRVRLDEAGNALGEIGDGDSSLLLCGHMDTVPGEIPVKETGGHLYGRGAADAKAALCAMLFAGASATGTGLRVTFAGVVHEEGDSLGVQTLIKSRKSYDYAVFGEPSGAARLTVGYRGRVAMKLSLSTEGGHAGSPWARVSALDELYSVITALRKLEANTPHGDHFRSISISPTIVTAGTYHNVVPPNCDATFDIRLPPGTSGARAVREAGAIVRGSVKEGTRVKFEFDEVTEAYEADPNSTLCRAFQRAVITKLRKRPVLVRKTGTGDMNTLASAMRIQCLTYGPGESDLSHTNHECVSVKDYLDSVEVLRESIKQIPALAEAR